MGDEEGSAHMRIGDRMGNAKTCDDVWGICFDAIFIGIDKIGK